MPRENHGRFGTPEYRSWDSMKQRCFNPKSKSYDRYGAIGITVCQEWQDSFMAFYRAMGDRPTSDHTLERVDNAKGYQPDNCRWATMHEQSRNRKNSRLYSLNGETKVARDWATQFGIPKNTLLARLDRGLSIEQAVAPVVESMTCVMGHAFDGINSYGHRICYRCARDRDAHRRKAKRAAR